MGDFNLAAILIEALIFVTLTVSGAVSLARWYAWLPLSVIAVFLMEVLRAMP